jgi:hypothetical protein
MLRGEINRMAMAMVSPHRLSMVRLVAHLLRKSPVFEVKMWHSWTIPSTLP